MGPGESSSSSLQSPAARLFTSFIGIYTKPPRKAHKPHHNVVVLASDRWQQRLGHIRANTASKTRSEPPIAAFCNTDMFQTAWRLQLSGSGLRYESRKKGQAEDEVEYSRTSRPGAVEGTSQEAWRGSEVHGVGVQGVGGLLVANKEEAEGAKVSGYCGAPGWVGEAIGPLRSGTIGI
ncbi:hypothetical protein MCOR13_000842 [Pyricularia oryzae]|nr:hypothetical protein MCOR13_000842 [Pyricularia oryzae]